MKQIISFKKDIPFDTKIGEITSISLEHNLKMMEQDHISGEFIISGDYKITDVSINREPFLYNLPFDITLDTRYSIENAKIDIDDFYYEITNSQIMNVNIDVLIDGIEAAPDYNIEKEGVEVKEERGSDIENIEKEEKVSEPVKQNIEDNNTTDNEDFFDDTNDRDIMDLFKEIETPPIDVSVEASASSLNDDKMKSLFESFDDKNETFTTYHVHIVRENDTIDSIVSKYKTTREELSAYNKIDELKLGDKIIIPESMHE